MYNEIQHIGVLYTEQFLATIPTLFPY